MQTNWRLICGVAHRQEETPTLFSPVWLNFARIPSPPVSPVTQTNFASPSVSARCPRCSYWSPAFCEYFFFFFCFLLPAFVPAIHCKSLYSIQSALTVFRLVYQRCRCRRENPGEILTFLYSLVGNLCGAVGATLARQLHIQVNGCNRGASLLSVVAHFCSLSSVGFSERCFCCPGCCPFYFLVLPCAPVLELKGG